MVVCETGAMRRVGPRAANTPRLAIGLMTGTSMDGIDAALIETDGGDRLQPGMALTHPLPGDLRTAMMAIASRPLVDRGDHTTLARALESVHAAAVESLLSRAGLASAAIDLIGFHGQTLYHAPRRGQPGAGKTWQLGDGSRLAARLGVPVAWDFRRRDVAAGGEGAPFAPAYHAAIAAGAGLMLPVALLNIGGVANVTWIGRARSLGDAPPLLAFDTGPGNALLDDWIAGRGLGNCDTQGRFAASGRINNTALDRLLSHDYFDRAPPKSLDRFSFTAEPVHGLDVGDGAATLTAFTAASIARAVEHMPRPPGRWLVCGGGRHNPTLMAALRDRLTSPVEPIEAIGFDGGHLEAQAFGYLAVRVARGLPLSFPGTTGVPEPMPGGRLSGPP